jgi:hypothetical protein
MAKLSKALLEYKQGEVDIESIAQISTTFRNAKNRIAEDYSGKVECNIFLSSYHTGKPTIQVIMKERKNGNLGAALKELFSLVGEPSFVDSGSNYSLTDDILQNRNKRLKRKIGDASRGKHVVDLNP